MNILIMQSAGKHKKNSDFRECLSFQRGLSFCGVRSEVYGPGYRYFGKVNFNDYDTILYLENYWKNYWFPDLSSHKGLKLFWSIDSHIVYRRHIDFVRRNNIDIVLCSNLRDTLKWGKKSFWFPNCYDNTLIDFFPEIKKKYDIGFCGNYVNRTNYINELEKDFRIKLDIFVIGKSMVNAINSYKIHWNKCYSYDLNYRIFETLGCKTFLLTNENSDLEKLFTVDKDLITYKDYEDCKKKIKYYLQNEAERNRIAYNGFEIVRKNHTYKSRAEKLIEIIKTNSK